MSIEVFDTHRAVKELQAAGFGDSQAEALVNTIGAANAALHNFPTKDDLNALARRHDERIDTMGNRLDERIDTMGSRLDERIDTMGSRLEERIDTMGSRLEERILTSTQLLEQRLTVKFGVGVVAIVAAVVGLVRGLDFLTGY